MVWFGFFFTGETRQLVLVIADRCQEGHSHLLGVTLTLVIFQFGGCFYGQAIKTKDHFLVELTFNLREPSKKALKRLCLLLGDSFSSRIG